MADRLGPRACEICGPTIEGCWKCGAKFGHAHIVIVSRDGSTLGRVAVCGTHAPDSGEMTTAGAEVLSRAALRDASTTSRTRKKRRRDRERRAAHRIVLDRHADEVAQVLADIRAGEGVADHA